MMKRFFGVLVAIACALPFSGCGQSGPLYLPENPSRMENVPPAPTDAEALDDETEDQDPEES